MERIPSTASMQPGTSPIRVWAEEEGDGSLLLTWAWEPEPTAPRDQEADARTVAATVSVVPGVSMSELAGPGVRIIWDPDRATKQEIGAAVRDALALTDDLRTRVNGLVRRIPSYVSLAQALALDERVSPVPEAARQVSSRGPTPAAMPLRFVPGFPLLSKILGILPVLGTLSHWSREASPEVVAQHLGAAGMTREQIDGDLATARESVDFARRYASDKASAAATRAASALAKARIATRDWVNQKTSQSDTEP